MANVYKILGASKPSAATETDIYTVPGATEAIISSIFVCNQSSTPTSFRIRADGAGAGDNDKQWLYYDIVIAGNETFVVVAGITLQAASVVAVYATLATLSFNIFGTEIS